MANPNLLNATSIYGKNVDAAGNNSNQTLITCPTDKLIKITNLQVFHDDQNCGGRIYLNGRLIAGGYDVPGDEKFFTIGGHYLTEGQTLIFWGNNSDTHCFVSYEEIDDA
jgi:hypothetical protein